MTETIKKINEMKLYKVISRDGLAQNGGDFDHKDYFPKNGKHGKWTPKREVRECSSGYHVTNYWNIWIKSDNIWDKTSITTRKEIGDSLKCPKCKKLTMHYTETDKYVERWCASCDYEFKFEKKKLHSNI